ncbi:HDIG domain protein [Olavius sp. associated proteobacterium Delta 1]|nr:HDIG domain protein [Olavius sp. associated proteobacterium Delta 1]
MEAVCDGCQNKHKSKDELLSGISKHVCNCRSRDENVKIDTELDQIAATSRDERESSTRACQSETAQNQEELKYRIIQSIKDLPPMPQVVIDLQHIISDPNSDISHLTGVIETDQAIAAKVLKMANSAFYGMSGKISSIHQASILLGYHTLGEIVTMAGTADILSGSMPGYGYDSQELWKHSLSVAFTAKMIAEIKNKDLIHEAHTAGLIHDVGKIILDRHIRQNMDQISVYMVQEEKTFLEAERYIFGFDHAEIASEVCQTWNIPENISLAIGSHHQPSISNGDELSYVIHMADYVATMGGISYDDDETFSELETGTMDFIGVRQDEISGIMLKVLEAVDQF